MYRERLQGFPARHVWPFQHWVETDTAAYLIRQYRASDYICPRLPTLTGPLCLLSAAVIRGTILTMTICVLSKRAVYASLKHRLASRPFLNMTEKVPLI
jgi:hypothetical protein